MAINITNQNFEEIISGDKPVLVDFWAEWCSPCKALIPILDELHEEYEGKAVIGKVNVDKEQTLATKFNIRSIPSIFTFKNGEVIGNFVGLQAKESLQKAINDLL